MLGCHSYLCQRIIAAPPSSIAYLGWCIPSLHHPVVSWLAHIPSRAANPILAGASHCRATISYLSPHIHSMLCCNFLIQHALYLPMNQSVWGGGGGQSFNAGGNNPLATSIRRDTSSRQPFGCIKIKLQYHTCVGTIIAVSKPISIQSLFLSLVQVITLCQQSLLYHPLPLTPRHTHLFPQSTTLPESFCLISTGTSSLPSHHILHQHTPLLQFNIFSSSRFIPSSATITRYVMPGQH